MALSIADVESIIVAQQIRLKENFRSLRVNG